MGLGQSNRLSAEITLSLCPDTRTWQRIGSNTIRIRVKSEYGTTPIAIVISNARRIRSAAQRPCPLQPRHRPARDRRARAPPPVAGAERVPRDRDQECSLCCGSGQYRFGTAPVSDAPPGIWIHALREAFHVEYLEPISHVFPCGTGEVLQNRTPAPATRRNSLLQNAMLCASPLASIVGPG